MSQFLIAEFRRYAEEAQERARTASNSQDMVRWKQVAERWLHCAVSAERGEARTPFNPARARRKADPIKRKRKAA